MQHIIIMLIKLIAIVQKHNLNVKNSWITKNKTYPTTISFDWNPN